MAGIAFGIMRLLDAQQRFTRNARPTYLRLRNFVLPQDSLYEQLGYTVMPPSGQPAGLTDVLIAPPPSMRMVSMHNIGMSMGKLRMGARQYIISASFVNAQQEAMNLDRPELVFYSTQTVGLFADSQLFEIVEAAHEEIGGVSVIWTVTVNGPERIV